MLWLLLSKKREDYYKPVRTDNFCSNNYIQYEINGNRNKALLKNILIKLDHIKRFHIWS